MLSTVIIIKGGDDYNSGPYNVTFPAGVTSVSFNITIINDNILEDNETFELIIDDSSLLSTVTTVIPNKTVIIIRDTDSKLCIV